MAMKDAKGASWAGSRRHLSGWIALAVVLTVSVTVPADRPSEERPNIVFIFVDDMGYGDLSVYRRESDPGPETPHIDRLAHEGVRLTQFYANSPICSPSRVAAITGQHPARWNIYGHLATRQRNQERGMVDWLDPDAVTLPRLLQEAGYATAQVGKWHLGGGRDVGDAPKPQAYGFEESLVAFEGLGDRLLINGHGLSKRSAGLGRGETTWVDKHEMSGIYVDHAIDFIERHRDQPFYVQLWLNDVHDPFQPAPEQLNTVDPPEGLPNPDQWQRFFAVLKNMDRQVGRLVSAIDRMGLGAETIILLTSDHGPTAWPRYYEDGGGEGAAPGYTAGLRGRKWSLYEGGIRVPFLIRWTGHTPAGTVNDTTVGAVDDLLPSLCALAGVELPEDYRGDGVDLSAAMLGKGEPVRARPIFWEYNSLGGNLEPGLQHDRSPTLAMRAGTWKVLVDPDGSSLELYELALDPRESNNLADRYPDRADRLARKLLNWYHRDLPEPKHGVEKPAIDPGLLKAGTPKITAPEP